MKQKKNQFVGKTFTISLLMLLFFSVNTLYSQKVQVNIGQELGLNKYHFIWTGDVNSNDYRFLQTPLFIDITAKVKGNFYLKVGFLPRRFKDILSFDWKSNDGKDKSKILKMNIEQYTFSIYPEYRQVFSEKLKAYFNIGLSYSKVVYIDKLISSHRFFLHEYYRDKRVGYAINVGIERELIKNLGISFSLGLSGDMGAISNSEFPVIELSRYYITYGIMYMF